VIRRAGILFAPLVTVPIDLIYYVRLLYCYVKYSEVKYMIYLTHLPVLLFNLYSLSHIEQNEEFKH